VEKYLRLLQICGYQCSLPIYVCATTNKYKTKTTEYAYPGPTSSPLHILPVRHLGTFSSLPLAEVLVPSITAPEARLSVGAMRISHEAMGIRISRSPKPGTTRPSETTRTATPIRQSEEVT